MRLWKEWRGKTAALLTLIDDLNEFEELAESAGYEILYEIIQRRKHPHTSTFIGKGKLEEIKKILSMRPVDVLLVNGDLKPSQHFNLENTLKIECIDRIGLVLEIFTQKAKDRKARLQVEKARLEYQIPFLREWIHNARMGEHPGFLGGGEYQVDVYYELIKRRIKKINEELRSINENQKITRTQRRKKGFFLVSLAGYTNAGKSSLLKALTGEEVKIDDKMFSTLSTVTRRLDKVRKKVLLTDTIGFFHDLPHFMIESFKNTIEEIFSSDLVLIVVDGTDPLPVLFSKLTTTIRIISPPVERKDMMIVLNKTDRIDLLDEIIQNINEKFSDLPVIPVSAKEGTGIEKLKEAILSFFVYPYTISFTVPNLTESVSFLSRLYDSNEIKSVDFGNEMMVSVRCGECDYAKIINEVEKLHGTVISTQISTEYSSESS